MVISKDRKPVSFSFNNTERCQSRCITCNGWKTPASVQDRELTIEEWKKILLNIHNWMGNYQFIISGGEPFIREDVYEMAEFASNLGDTVNIVTNGLALPDKLDKVLNSAFTNITFSLNAIQNPEIHNISRGRKDAFQRTIDAIQNLNYMNKYRGGHKWKNIFLSTVVMPSNLSEIKPIAEFCKIEGIGVSYQLMDNGDAFSTNVSSNSQIYGKDIKKAALDAIDEMIELKNQGYPICNGFSQLNAFKVLIDTPEKIQNIQCMVGENNFAIDPYGNCRICFCMKPIGNLKNNLPQDLWYSREADEVREHILNCTRNCRLLNCNFK
ncbi:TPA: radical SAM protein [Candidatus Avigastranaerophilus faecigallinarum]|nr:radical SAM protein [Candidatus Avigastranaerophilus faecigallinarum]